MTPDDGVGGQQGLPDASSDFSTKSFISQQEMYRQAPPMPVKVVKVNGTTDSTGDHIATIDVQPLVNQVDGTDKMTPHGVIHGIPFTRSQGGGNGIVCDPKVGDIGMIAISGRDISAVKAKRGQANPGSRRKNDFSDAVYTGAILNGPLSKFIQFTDDGIVISVPGSKITINASGIAMETAQLTVTGDIIAKVNGVDIHLSTHLHSDVLSGPSDTGPPVSGT